MEPRLDSHSVRKCEMSHAWPHPGVVSSVAGRVRIPNLLSEPNVLKRHQHFCKVDPLSPPSTPHPAPASYTITPMVTHLPLLTTGVQHSRGIQVDPDNLLPPGFKDRFHTLLEQYNEVFNSTISGPFESKVSQLSHPNAKAAYPCMAETNLPSCNRNSMSWRVWGSSNAQRI